MTTRSVAARPRVAIVGGGAAGVICAWLLDGACDVVLFEAQDRLGGHAHTVTVEHRGQLQHVDLGAQFYSPSLQPAFVRLMEDLGVYDPKRPDSAGSITREMGISVGDFGAPRPRFVSPMFWQRVWPLVVPWNLPAMRAFFAFARAVKPFDRHGDWDLVLDDWLRSVPGLSAEQREHVILPWLTALTGCSIEAARGLSARAAVAPGARVLSDGLVAAFHVSHATIGLGAVIEAMTTRCSTLTVRRKAPVIAIQRTPDAPRVVTPGAAPEAFDHVVLAAPPHALAPMFEAEPELQGWLRRFAWFPSQLAIHDQPTFMPPDRRDWSAHTSLTTGGHCEASVWYGAIRDRMADGRTVDIFKSWVSARSVEPGGLLATAHYKHPLPTPDFVRAQAEVERRQGHGKVWLAGSWTRDVDLQENAFGSALWVAERLAPLATNLVRLKARIG